MSEDKEMPYAKWRRENDEYLRELLSQDDMDEFIFQVWLAGMEAGMQQMSKYIKW